MPVKSKSACRAEHDSWSNTYVVASCMSCYTNDSSGSAGYFSASVHDEDTRDTYLYEKENLIVQQFLVTQRDAGVARVLHDFAIIVLYERLEKEGCDF